MPSHYCTTCTTTALHREDTEKKERVASVLEGVKISTHPFWECESLYPPSNPPTHLEVPLPGVLQVLHGAAVRLLQAVLPPLVLRLQLVQLHPQVLPLLAELVLQLLQRRLRLGQLHLQALLQQRDLGAQRDNVRTTSTDVSEWNSWMKPPHLLWTGLHSQEKRREGAGAERTF